MLGTKIRAFALLPNLSLEDLVCYCLSLGRAKEIVRKMGCTPPVFLLARRGLRPKA